MKYRLADEIAKSISHTITIPFSLVHTSCDNCFLIQENGVSEEPEAKKAKVEEPKVEVKKVEVKKDEEEDDYTNPKLLMYGKKEKINGTLLTRSEILTSVHPETASFGPCLRSRSIEILDVVPLRLRLQFRYGLGLNQNLPFLDGH